MSKQMLFLILICVFSFFKLIAQNKPDQLLKVVPPSPGVAALGKYGEIPVGLYTGVPNISIPLYEIKDGNLDLPISLSYHAGGIKVEEIASSVGLGWTLNAGGVLGRNVRGLPDEITGWASQEPANQVESIMLSRDYKRIDQLAINVNRGISDGEADLYYYNFNQYSGKFFYDQSGIVHTQSQQNLLINQIAKGWKITAEDGTVYTFEKVEQVSSSSCSVDQNVYSAWFLTSIKSADGSREISFIYDQVNYTYETLVGQTKYFSTNSTGNACMPNPSPCLGTHNYNTFKLARINFSGGYIKFSSNTVRCDLMMDKALDSISVYNNRNELLRRFRFSYSYFGSNNNGCTIATQNSKRLKLISVTEESTGLQKPPYKFDYNESIEFPGRLSYAQDHWGYFNGKPNTDLIATFTTMVSSGQHFTVPGADRKANPQTAQAGILTRIKYPTGGETKFTYESNTVSDGYIEHQTTNRGISFSADQLTSTLPRPFESDELVIPSAGAQVNAYVSGLDGSSWYGCDFVRCYVIKDNNPIPFAQIDNGWNTTTFHLSAGTYKLRLVTECSDISKASFSIAIIAEIPTSESLTIRPVGGLRVKQIEDNPGNGSEPVIKKYRYTKEEDSTRSSGALVNFPDYGYSLNVRSVTLDDRGNAYPATYCSYNVRQSFTNYPLATTQGSYVGYRRVIVDLGDHGESRYYYNAYSDAISPTFPFAPIENFDWTRGFLLKSQEFARKNGKLVLAKETINIPENFNQVRVYGIKTGSNEYDIIGGEMVPHRQPVPVFTFYPTITEFYSLGQTREKLYDQNDPLKFIETVTDYTYSPQHLQLVQTKTRTSKSDLASVEEVVTNKKYPFDYSFTGVPVGPEATGIKNLQNLHVTNAVIEEYTFKQKRSIATNQVSNQRIVDGSITTYKNDKPYPDQILGLEIGSSIPLADYGSGSLLNANTFVKNANAAINGAYKPEVIFNSYDERGNITTQQKADDIKKAYIWGYQSTYPVAEVTGADYSTIMATLKLNQVILQDSTSNDELVRAELDNVRKAFPTAQVTTFTYKPLVGISSQTDMNNRTSYYEYDSFGRLILVRDQDKNIVKRFCYNYNGQQGSCAVNASNP